MVEEVIGVLLVFGFGFGVGWWLKVWQLHRKEFRNDF